MCQGGKAVGLGRRGVWDSDFSEGRGGGLREDSLGGRLPCDHDQEGGVREAPWRGWEGRGCMHSCGWRVGMCTEPPRAWAGPC